MAVTFTPDSNAGYILGLDKLRPNHVLRMPGRLVAGNPYAGGGVAYTVATFKAALEAAFGDVGTLPTLVLDGIEVLGPSTDMLCQLGWTGTAVVAYALTGTPLTLTAADEDLTGADIVAHVATLHHADNLSVVQIGLENAGGVVPLTAILPAGGVPAATGEVAWDPAAHTITCLAADAITHVYARYTRYTAAVAPAEFGAVDLSAAAKSCPAEVLFHLA